MKNEDYFYMQTPIGWIELKATANFLSGIRAVSAPGEKTSGSETVPVLQQASRQLTEYFEGKRTTFDIPLRLKGTPYQQKVWEELQKIPYGERISYKELARRAGNPKGCRAAGSANGKNPAFIVVPCHRVIQSNGTLGGFAYGLDMKKQLLSLEDKHSNKLLL